MRGLRDARILLLLIAGPIAGVVAPAVPGRGDLIEAPAAALSIVSLAASEASARANAHLIMGRRDAILVDTAMTVPDAEVLARWVEASGRRLRAIFITNSQPDRTLGIEVLSERFPAARLISTPEVVADMRARGLGYLVGLRGRWGGEIPAQLVLPEPLASDHLELEGREIRVYRFRGGESTNSAALFVPALGALLPGAIVFEKTHLFLHERDIPGWRAQLAWIRGHGGIERIYPGYGAATDLSVLDAMERYLSDFEQAVVLGDANAAVAYMTDRYPDYALARLLRDSSVPAFLGTPAVGAPAE